MVNLPFKTPLPLLGDSKTRALQQYKPFENRLNRNQNIRQQYVEFMQDYLTSDHMELIRMTN